MTDVLRFAPSPTGRMHSGNANIALENFFWAKQMGALFILRIEDTDLARSSERLIEALIEDLTWLGIRWDRGPDTHADMRQSNRFDLYQQYFQILHDAGHAYVCRCSDAQLEADRNNQIAARLPPRYTGRCRDQHFPYQSDSVLRFKVPMSQDIVWDDAIRGEQRFKSDSIGDFIIRRTDGYPTFLYANALDDRLMCVTHIMRGEDHISNTARQILIWKALGEHDPIPVYAHSPLILGSDGLRYSKRNGSLSLHDLREKGYRSEAVCNALARIGQKNYAPRVLSMDELITGFEVSQIQKSPAQFSQENLSFWQKKSLQSLSLEDFAAWACVSCHRLAQLIRPHVTTLQDVQDWVGMIESLIFHESELTQDMIRLAKIDDFWSCFRQCIHDDHGYEWLKSAPIENAENIEKKHRMMLMRWVLSGKAHGPEVSALWVYYSVKKRQDRLNSAYEKFCEKTSNL